MANEFKIKNGIVIDGGQPVDYISTDTTLSATSDTNLVTEKAIKTYTTTQINDLGINQYATSADLDTHTSDTSIHFTKDSIDGLVTSAGNNGQVLMKNTNTDYDYDWATLPGGGDMLKATYDVTDNGIVDNSEALGGQAPSYYATRASVLPEDVSALGVETGVLYGCDLSINVDTTKFDITSGAILVADHADPENPTYQVILVPAQTGSPNLLGVRSKWVGINASGNFEYETEFTADQRRNIAIVGRVFGPNDGNITTAANYTYRSWGVLKTMEDLMDVFGSLNINGNVYGVNGSNLLLNKTLGESFRYGANYETNPDSPNELIDPQQTAISTYQYHVFGSIVTTAESDIDPNNWDDGGVKTLVTNDYWTVQRIYYFPKSGNTHVVYGQTEYTTLDEAKNHYIDDGVNLNENLLSGSILRSYLFVKQGATQLNLSTEALLVDASTPWSSIAGTGDMRKEVYDTTDNGVVDDSERLNGQLPGYYSTSADLNAHIIDYTNPHQVDKTDVALGNVDNTSDADKPISTATQTALDGKEDYLGTGTTGQILATSGADVRYWVENSGAFTPNLIQVLTEGADAGNIGITNLGATDMVGNLDMNGNDIVDAGAIGIGTDNPTQNLHIVDTTTPTIKIEHTDAASASFMEFRQAGLLNGYFGVFGTAYPTTAWRGNIDIDTFVDNTQGNIILGRANANVGIGTDSPTAKLDVVGLIKSSATISEINAESTGQVVPTRNWVEENIYNVAPLFERYERYPITASGTTLEPYKTGMLDASIGCLELELPANVEGNFDWYAFTLNQNSNHGRIIVAGGTQLIQGRDVLSIPTCNARVVVRGIGIAGSLGYEIIADERVYNRIVTVTEDLALPSGFESGALYEFVVSDGGIATILMRNYTGDHTGQKAVFSKISGVNSECRVISEDGTFNETITVDSTGFTVSVGSTGFFISQDSRKSDTDVTVTLYPTDQLSTIEPTYGLLVATNPPEGTVVTPIIASSDPLSPSSLGFYMEDVSSFSGDITERDIVSIANVRLVQGEKTKIQIKFKYYEYDIATGTLNPTPITTTSYSTEFDNEDIFTEIRVSGVLMENDWTGKLPVVEFLAYKDKADKDTQLEFKIGGSTASRTTINVPSGNVSKQNLKETLEAGNFAGKQIKGLTAGDAGSTDAANVLQVEGYAVAKTGDTMSGNLDLNGNDIVVVGTVDGRDVAVDGTKLDGIAANANNYILPFTDNSTNWNTAFSWGDHASAGYAQSSSLGNYLPLAGGEMSGDLTISKAVGSGITNPVVMRLKNTTAGTFIDEGDMWSYVEHYSEDTSLGGAKPHARIGASLASISGGYSDYRLQLADVTGVLKDAFTVFGYNRLMVLAGALSTAGNIETGGSPTSGIVTTLHSSVVSDGDTFPSTVLQRKNAVTKTNARYEWLIGSTGILSLYTSDDNNTNSNTITISPNGDIDINGVFRSFATISEINAESTGQVVPTRNWVEENIYNVATYTTIDLDTIALGRAYITGSTGAPIGASETNGYVYTYTVNNVGELYKQEFRPFNSNEIWVRSKFSLSTWSDWELLARDAAEPAGWVQLGTSGVYYCRRNGIVYMKGLNTSGSTTLTGGILPIGYRPSEQIESNILQNGFTNTTVIINPLTGVIFDSNAVAAQTSFDTFSFPAEQ